MLMQWILAPLLAIRRLDSQSIASRRLRYRPCFDDLEGRLVPAITLVKTATPSVVNIGQTVTYRLGITVDTFTESVQLVDVVPTQFTLLSATADAGGVVTTASVAGGVSITVSFATLTALTPGNLTIVTRADTAGTFTNTATVTGIQSEGEVDVSASASAVVNVLAPSPGRIPMQSSDDKQEGFNPGAFNPGNAQGKARRQSQLKRLKRLNAQRRAQGLPPIRIQPKQADIFFAAEASRSLATLD